MANYEKDFKIKAEWNFFASSHGKGVCDGIGGTVKRHAYRTSFQWFEGNAINNFRKLFKWAKGFFNNIDLDFYPEAEHDLYDKKCRSVLKKLSQ